MISTWGNFMNHNNRKVSSKIEKQSPQREEISNFNMELPRKLKFEEQDLRHEGDNAKKEHQKSPSESFEPLAKDESAHAQDVSP